MANYRRFFSFLFLAITIFLPLEIQSRERTVSEGLLIELIQQQSPLLQSKKMEQIIDCSQGRSRCSPQGRQVVINAILLKGRFTLSIGQPCIRNHNAFSVWYPPPFQDGVEAYIDWQDLILDAPQDKFCDPFRHLECGPQSRCVCLKGLNWDPKNIPNACLSYVGSYCTGRVNDQNPSLTHFYDPYYIDPTDVDVIGPIGIFPGNPAPLPHAVCFPNYPIIQCRENLNFYLPWFCSDPSAREIDAKLAHHLQNSTRLQQGDECDPIRHSKLYYTPEVEWRQNHTTRRKYLENILAANTKFCDLRELQICNKNLTCDCMDPTTFDSQTQKCMFPTMDNLCDKISDLTSSLGILVNFGVRELNEGIQKVLDLGCSGVHQCINERVEDFKEFSYCGCKQLGVVGANCDTPLTSLIEERLRPSQLPSDLEMEDKKFEVFLELNKKALEFEKIFTREVGKDCNFNDEMEARLTVRRIRNLGTNEIMHPAMTEQDYKDMVASMTRLETQYRTNGDSNGTNGNSNGTNGMCKILMFPHVDGAHPEDYLRPWDRPLTMCPNKKCENVTHKIYADILANLMKQNEVIPTGGRCNLSDIKTLVQTTVKQAENYSSPFGRVMDFLEGHLAARTQFCNRTAGLTCASGICTFSAQVLEEVQRELNSTGDNDNSDNSDNSDKGRLGLDEDEGSHILPWLDILLLSLTAILILN